MERLLPEGREIAKPFALQICILMSDVKVIRPRVELWIAKRIFAFLIFAAVVYLRLQTQTL